MRLKSWWLMINVSTCPTKGSWACLNHIFFVVSLSLTTNKEISLSFHVPGSPPRWVPEAWQDLLDTGICNLRNLAMCHPTLLRVEQLEHQACLQPANICTVACSKTSIPDPLQPALVHTTDDAQYNTAGLYLITMICLCFFFCRFFRCLWQKAR